MSYRDDVMPAGYRCLKDLSSYCAGTKNRQEEEGTAAYMSGNQRRVMKPFSVIKCPKDPSKCPQFRTWEQECRRLLGENYARTSTPASPGTAGAISRKTPRRARPDTC